MENLSLVDYKQIVDECGGSKSFDLKHDNYFVVLDHRTNKFRHFTVNDGFEAPERFYMDLETAEKVVAKLNEVSR